MYYIALLLPLLLSSASPKCFDPSPAFPVPAWQHEHRGQSLAPALFRMTDQLKELAKVEKYDTSSFSVSLTSQTGTLWQHHHTARVHNETRPGDTSIDDQSLYRIASITKTFTTLGLLHQQKAGNLSLDDAVSKYIPELHGSVPWKDITLRLLASQLSGIPREIAQADLINAYPHPEHVGLPPVSKDDYDLDLPECYEYKDYQPCNWTQLLPHVYKAVPIFAPGQESTYSNANFELLGLVLERVTGLLYEEYMEAAIFDPIGMSQSTLTTPTSDEHAVLPVGQWFWDVDEGVHNPTGGIYSSSSDMMRYARYILTHYNALATGVNWFMPASWSGSAQTFYGMPWEIYRTTEILPESRRPVTFVTKGGAVPMYFSKLSFMPEYGLALTILVGGESELVDKAQEIVLSALIPQAEKVIWEDIQATYTRTYTAVNSSLNSSLTLTASPSRGLEMTAFISNNTNVFTSLISLWADLTHFDQAWRVQLVPTLLFKNETAQEGEIWRMLLVADRKAGQKEGIWDEFCSTDVDPMSYAGLPINEMVFWHERGVLELPAWRVEMKMEKAGDEKWQEDGETFVVQT